MITVSNSDEKKGKKIYPAYGNAKWYKDFLELLERRQVDSVNKNFLKPYKIASGNESKFIRGLKFLKLIDEKGNATDELNKLSLRGEEKAKNLEKIVRIAYSDIFSKIDVEKAILDDIINSFISGYEVSPNVAKEATKIFLFLTSESGINLSGQLKENIPTDRKVGVKKPRSQRKKIERKKTEGVVDMKIEGMHQILWGDDIQIYLKEGDISVAEKAKDLIDIYIKDVRSLEKK